MMDNLSIPSVADALLGSSNAFQQFTPPQSPSQKSVPNDKAAIFIDTLNNIKSGHISKQAAFDPALSGLCRKVANHLLLARQKDGIAGYLKAYIAIISDDALLNDLALLLLSPMQDNKSIAPVGTLLSQVQGEEVHWLWQRRLPLGKLTTLDGDPGLGKSNLTLDIAARVSTGREMPDGTPGIAGGAGVVLIAPEDGLADTIQPRLQRAGANLSRIVSISSIPTLNPNTNYTYERPFMLPFDFKILQKAIERVQAKLVVIDPLMAIFSSKDTYKDNEVRMALAPVQRLIEQAGTACLMVRHLSKTSGTNALYRAGGSIAFIAIARSGLMVLKDPTDESKRVLAHVKSNLSVGAANLSFSVASDEDHGGDNRPYIRWLGATTHTIQELLNPPLPTAIHLLGAGRQEILRVLEEHYPEVLSIKALAAVLPEMSYTNLNLTLKRMAEDGQIEKVGRGEYHALSASSLSPEK